MRYQSLVGFFMLKALKKKQAKLKELK